MTVNDVMLSPPFAVEHGTGSAEAIVADLPVSVTVHGKQFRPARDFPFFLATELETRSIDQVATLLWFIRRSWRANPLHRQRISRREIVITENPSEHLVSDYSVIFVKPLPGYLLSHDFWTQHLSQNRALHAAACGMVLSYTWLVAFQSDFEIARELRLLPGDLTWRAWTAFVASFLDHIEAAAPRRIVSNRYLYGELHMGRLNYIFKLKPSLWRSDNILRGFMPTSMWNKSFMEQNIARLLAIFVFLSLALSAMQVGLATSQLQENASFVGASYSFAVACLFIALLCGVIGLVSLVWLLISKLLLPWKMSLLLADMRGHDHR
jgi:hypothetical protein